MNTTKILMAVIMAVGLALPAAAYAGNPGGGGNGGGNGNGGGGGRTGEFYDDDYDPLDKFISDIGPPSENFDNNREWAEAYTQHERRWMNALGEYGVHQMTNGAGNR